MYKRQVQPRAPRPPRFSAGPGVKLIRDGSVAVAEITGRPIFRGGQLQVNPQLVVDGNVDVDVYKRQGRTWQECQNTHDECHAKRFACLFRPSLRG